ncbi:phage GP46 family protein [Roseateles sp. SL47]|uniref:phage GP46 family protein n=1 Tax=Roseateles sp. SL47 TaxID=2995138 RepID=UPI002270AF96|nr:phage GP46 family protein [Roseateles sp. SL47]WAC71111.1 phage GP46 family protein [Roseateles sp. SL47]
MSDTYIDPISADYVQSAGDLARDPADGLANAVYLRVMTPLGSWWADTSLGSRLHELQREKDVPRVQRLAVQFVQQCLQPLVDDGRALAVDVQAEHASGRLNLLVTITDAGQAERTFDFFIKVG